MREKNEIGYSVFLFQVKILQTLQLLNMIENKVQI